MVLEKTLESPLACKETQPVHSEGDQPWDLFGGNDAETENRFYLMSSFCVRKYLTKTPFNFLSPVGEGEGKFHCLNYSKETEAQSVKGLP